MKAKAFVIALGVGLFIVALLFAWGSGKKNSPARKSALTNPKERRYIIAKSPDNPPPMIAPPIAVAPAPSNSPTPFATAAVVVHTPAPAASAESSETRAATRPRDAQVDVNKVHLMLRDYHTLMGENPVGTNAEIMQALMGHNPKQATVGPPEGMSLNGKGELIDQWGTPYFFHQLSRDVMEIHSAGPDKVMWTADDIVIR